MHTLVVKDEYGHSKQMSLFVVKETGGGGGIINRVTTVMPLGFAYAAMVWLIIFIVLLINMLRLARKVDVEEAHEKKSHYYRHALYFSAIALVLTSLVGVVVNNKTKIFNNFFQQVKPAEHKLVKVSGTVLDPVSLQGVSGVDLASQNSTIHTAEGGMYAFEDIDASYGLLVTHPLLQRAVLIRISDAKPNSPFDIYFDSKLYNALNSYVVAMIQKSWMRAYDLLAGISREKITVDDLSKTQTIFTDKNLSDQEMVVARVIVLNNWFSNQYQAHFDKAIQVTLASGTKTEDYYLVKEGQDWKIVK